MIRKYIIIIGCMALGSCASIPNGMKVSSETGCCSYTLYEDECLTYEEDGYHRTYCGDQLTLEETIHEIEENCYKNH